MVVRKLRVRTTAAGAGIAGIDSVTDPAMLAHRLLNLESSSEVRHVDHKLRMSSLHRVCVRAQLLSLRDNLVVRETLPVSLRVTFDIGNAIHEFLQNSSGYFGGNLFGWWQCLACQGKVFGRKPLSKCSCGASARASRYVEHALRLPDGIPVSGHIDGFLEVAPGDIRVVDFKTINGDEFDALSAPKPEHMLQVTGYMHFAQMDDTLPVRIAPRSGLVLYVSKKHAARALPFKMFHVRHDPMYLTVIEEKVALFRRGLSAADFLPPPVSVCTGSGFRSSVSRACPAHALCVREDCG